MLKNGGKVASLNLYPRWGLVLGREIRGQHRLSPTLLKYVDLALKVDIDRIEASVTICFIREVIWMMVNGQ